MALIHVSKEDANDLGEQSWRLYDRSKVSITVFAEFCRKMVGLGEATKDRYSTVVARFIDYLYEVQVLGAGPVSRSTVNSAIDYYLALLRHGESVSLSYGKRGDRRHADGDEAREAQLRAVAKKLGITPLASASWANTLAALNRFLKLCELLEREAKEMALNTPGIERQLVAEAELDYRPLLQAVDGVSALSSMEVNHLKHATMLGGVIRFRGSKLTRPKGLRQSSRQQSQVDVNSLDFPQEHFQKLVDSATYWRDRALWALLMASGIRRSEGLNLQWCDIDFIKQEVYVLDPELLRYGRDITPEERKLRFKGRIVSWTYLRQPYRDQFFEYLREYRRNEYRLPLDGNDYVFQYLISPHYGRPLHEATDETLNSAFTSAVQRAGIPGPPIDRSYVWTGHSLRHAYGMYMLNDVGLTEAEVQLLMGHKDISSTRKYAKPRDAVLKAKLLAIDREHIRGEARRTIAAPPALAPSALLLGGAK